MSEGVKIEKKHKSIIKAIIPTTKYAYSRNRTNEPEIYRRTDRGNRRR